MDITHVTARRKKFVVKADDATIIFTVMPPVAPGGFLRLALHRAKAANFDWRARLTLGRPPFLEGR